MASTANRRRQQADEPALYPVAPPPAKGKPAAAVPAPKPAQQSVPDSKKQPPKPVQEPIGDEVQESIGDELENGPGLVEDSIEGHAHHRNRSLRRFLAGETRHETQRRVIELSTITSLGEIARNGLRLTMSTAQAQRFQKSHFDQASRTTVLSGEINQAQVPRVALLGYSIPFVGVDFGLRTPTLQNKLRPTIISPGGIGLQTILRGGTSVDYSLTKKRRGILIHNNPEQLDPAIFERWSGVTEAQLREGVVAHPTDSSVLIVDLKKNDKLNYLFHHPQNLENLVEDFPELDLDSIQHQLDRGLGHRVELPTAVVNLLIDQGLEMGIKQVKSSTQPLDAVPFELVSTTTEDGSFSDLVAQVQALHGALAQHELDAKRKISLTLEVRATLAGVHEMNVEFPYEEGEESDGEGVRSRGQSPGRYGGGDG